MWELIQSGVRDLCQKHCCFGTMCKEKGSNFTRRKIVNPSEDENLKEVFSKCGSYDNLCISYTPIKKLKTRRF